MKKFAIALATAALLATTAAASAQSTLRIGLQEDPDFLDPHRARTYVSRLVFTALCDKLIDSTPDLQFTPRLATEWAWSPDNKTLTMKLRDGVKFHDGEPFNAEAVKFNIERARTLPDSMRKSEISSIDTVEVVDPLTVKFNLKRPDAALLSQLTDRAGMMLSPKAVSAPDFAQKPVCSGPYKFVQRVPQDRIVLEKFDGYWNKDALGFDRVVFLPIPDQTVRLANLRSGGLDIVERLAATDVKSAKEDPNLTVISVPGLGFQQIDINTNNGEQSNTPLGKDARVRQALALTLDRGALNDVVFEGLYTPGAQPFAPASPFYVKDIPMARDVEKAKALLKEAGVTMPFKFELRVPNNPVLQQVGQVIQAMASEGGFEVSLLAGEYASMLKEMEQGKYQATIQGWSGRMDPDGNIHQFVTCAGSQNDAKYCNKELDALLNEARATNELEKRKELYKQALVLMDRDMQAIYMYYEPRIFAMTKKVDGFVPYPDGMIRFEGLKYAQ